MSNIVLWGTPQGELFIFHTEDEVKLFWCKTGLEPEDLSEYGVIVDTNGEDDEWVLEECPAYTSPVFRRNPYFSIEEEAMGLETNVCVYRPENITLDNTVWKDFPVVMMLHRESGFDRSGDIEIDYMLVEPLSNLTTVHDLEETHQKYTSVWKDNREKWIEHSEMLEAKRNHD